MLFKNVLRTLQKQWLSLILLGVMITLSSFIYSTMDYSMQGIINPTDQYFEDANQEDFAISMIDILLEEDVIHIVDNCPAVAALPPDNWPYTLSGLKTIDNTCYYGVIDKRVDLIESTYDDITLEVRESKDVYFKNNDQSFRFRVLKELDYINTSYFVAGKAPANSNQLAVSEVFANNHNLDVGDTFTMKGKDYKISGYVLFPDYSLTIFGQELILDNYTQSIVLLSNDEFESIDETVMFEIAGVFENGYTSDEFEKNVMDDYRDQESLGFITNIVLTLNNMRSGAIYAELEGGQATNIFLSLLIASIALMIVGIMVSRVLHQQRGPIGILKSMGYTNAQIAFPYILFIGILSLPAILLGYYLGLLMAEPFMWIYLDFYLLPYQPIAQSAKTIIVAIIVPFTFIVGLSYFIVRRLLNQKPVTLLNPEVTSSTNKFTKMMSKYLKRFNITTKLQQLLLFRNIVKFTVFLIGMYFAAFLILFTFSMDGIFDRMLYDYYDQTNHNYIGYCDYVGECEVPLDGEIVIDLPSVVVNDDDASIVGLNTNSTIHPILNNKGDNILTSLKDGAIITESIQLTRGYRVGDMLTIEIGEDTFNVEVVAVAKEYSGNKVYVDRELLSETITDDNTYYNAVYTKEEISRDDYLVVIDIERIIEQADNMQGFMSAAVYIMVIVSISVGAIIIYILTVMTIEDNFYNISLFKVLGYNDKEINKMILGGYRFYGIVIFVINIPIAILSFWIMEVFFAQFYDLLFPLEFAWWHAIFSVAIYLIIFYLGAWSAKRKLGKISLQEAMKMYQV